MALAINLPDLVYIIMSLFGTRSVALISSFVFLEQFGYGFGFTAYTMFLIYIARGEHKTAHYAIGTGFMALGMMLPGMVAGWIADSIGYNLFFVWVCICIIPGIVASFMVKKKLPAEFGRKQD